MRMLMILTSILASLALAAAVVPVIAVEEPKGQQVFPSFLKGNKIGLYESGYRTVPADQPSFVCHGFQWPNWPKDYSAQERKSLLTEYSFGLEIDGVVVGLRKFVHYAEGSMNILYYVQFEANHFAVGTYTFRAVWYGPSMTVQRESLVTVEFY